MDCDVLIIGGGPAGASLAYYLSGKNYKVIIVEKKKEIDTPVRCAELVPVNFAGLFDFKISGINNHIDFMDTFMQDAGNFLPAQKPGFEKVKRNNAPGFMLDREVFIKDLIERYKRNGGVFLKGAKAVSMDTGISNPGTAGKHKLVTVMINASDKNSYLRKQTLNVSAKIIVGADGPMSAIGKLMGSENKKFMLGFQERLQLKYNLLKLSPGKGNLKQCPDSCCGTKMNAAGFYFSPFIKKGYGWIFPKKDYFNVGVGIEQGSSRMLKEIYNLFKNQVLAGDFSLNNAVNSSGAEPGAHAHNGRQIATVLNTITGLIPVSGMTGNPVCENLILAGDAAGLADPLTGAGIYNAVYSARIVSGIIQKSLEKDDLYMLREIISVYKKEFGPSLARSLAGKELQEKSWPVLENLNEKGNEDTGFAMLIKKSWPMFKEYYAST